MMVFKFFAVIELIGNAGDQIPFAPLRSNRSGQKMVSGLLPPLIANDIGIAVGRGVRSLHNAPIADVPITPLGKKLLVR